MDPARSPQPTLADISVDLTEEERRAFEHKFHRYCAIVLCIYERLERQRPDLIDELLRNRSMKTKVNSSTS